MTPIKPIPFLTINNKEYQVPSEVKNFIDALIKRDGVARELIRSLSQTTVDLSASMIPFSGLTMIGLFALAKQCAEFLGEEIEPSESAFEVTINMVTTIRRPLHKKIDELEDTASRLEGEVARLKKELEEHQQKSSELTKVYADSEVTCNDLDRRKALASKVIHKKARDGHFLEFVIRMCFHDDGTPRDYQPKLLRDALQKHPYFNEILSEGYDYDE